MTVKKSTLEGKRGDYETQLIERLQAAIAKDVSRWFFLADRGFGDHKLYEFLEGLGWDFVIRFEVGASWWRTPGASSAPRRTGSPRTGRATMPGGVRVTPGRDRAPRFQRWSSSARPR